MRMMTADDVGAALRRGREGAGLTQAALASRIGASRQWVVDAEAGKPTVRLAMMLRAIQAVGLDVDVSPFERSPLMAKLAEELGDV
jgi:transcriptional regulator with XRE-family HTH domain